MNVEEALTEARKVIVSGDEWALGAYTPARCAFHNLLDKAGQARLNAWVEKEKELGRCHSEQLPKNVNAATA